MEDLHRPLPDQGALLRQRQHHVRHVDLAIDGFTSQAEVPQPHDSLDEPPVHGTAHQRDDSLRPRGTLAVDLNLGFDATEE